MLKKPQSPSPICRRSARRRPGAPAAVEAMERRVCLSTTFAAAVSHAVGGLADFVDTADFNNDGKRDVVVSSYAGSRLSLLLGNGDGTFQPRIDLVQSTAPDFVTVADVNNDSNADLLTVNYTDSTIWIHLGNGDGTFASPAIYSGGTGPRSLVLGDFTGDGKVDIVVAKSFTKAITLLRNNGNGTFQAPVNAAVSFTPVDLVAGDFNGDGKLDLAAADFYTDRVALVLGNGNGTFQAAALYTTGAGPASIVAGDFNRDGRMDVATANFDGSSISILRGNGDGTLQAPTTLAAGSGATHLIAADFSGNGAIDLVATNANANTVSVFVNNGSGSFASAVNFAVGSSPRSAAVANFNGGGLDIVVANQGSTTVSVLLGNGTAFPPSANPGASYDVNENGTVQLSGLASTGSDLTYAWDLDGDGIYGEFGLAAKRGDEVGPTPVFSAVGVDGPDTRTVRLRVTDANGLSDTAQVVIWIRNVAPTLTISGAANVAVGAVYSLSLASSDPGPDTIVSWTITWGDGSSHSVGNVATATKAYAAPGTYTITATATDEDGTYNSNSRTITVFSPPTANAGASYNVNEGGTVQLSGAGSTGTGLSYAWDLDGDGIFGEFGLAAKRGDEVGVTPVFSAATIDGPDTRTVRLRVTDAYGLSDTAQVVIWIQNVAPTLTISGPTTIVAGGTYTLFLAAGGDPGPDTITGWVIDWGDGTTSSVGAVASATKVYAAAGTYTIGATATDEDGTYASNGLSVGVTSAVDTTPPTAMLSPVATVLTAGVAGTALVVTYADNVALDFASLDSADLLVTGPNGFSALATFVSVTAGGVATYSITAPLGAAWDVPHNGTYTVALQAGQVRDAAGNFAAAGTLGTFNIAVPVTDTAGNTLDTARNFGSMPAGTVKVAEDGVGVSDKNDFFRFTVDTTLELTARLTLLKDNATLQLQDAAGNVLVTSKRAGTSDESITRTLGAGTYYLRVLYAGSNGFTTYRLRAATAAVVVDPGILTATDTGPLSAGAVKLLSGSLTTSSKTHYYRFTVGSTSDVSLRLSGLSANADLQILDSTGTVLATSKKSGTTNEDLRRTLAAGTYFVKVILKANASTPYQLRLANDSVL